MNKDMYTRNVIALTFITLSFGCLAQDHPGYLNFDTAPDGLALLPPPPAEGSLAFSLDKENYLTAHKVLKTPRGLQAMADADMSVENVLHTFSPSYGQTLSVKTTPYTVKIIDALRFDAGLSSTQSTKVKYQRVRPFDYYHVQSCTPDLDNELKKNGSYPSGHAAAGWAIALVLSEIKPGRQPALLAQGYEYGQSRVICGVHWQSDVDAARLLASAMIAKLHADPLFISDLEQAKKEAKDEK